MPGAQKKRKTWEEKLNDAKDLPKVVQLRGKAKQRWHANTLPNCISSRDILFHSAGTRGERGYHRGSAIGRRKKACR